MQIYSIYLAKEKKTMDKKANTEYTSYIIFDPECDEDYGNVETLHIKYKDGKAIDVVVEDESDSRCDVFLENSEYLKTKDIIGKTHEEIETLLEEAFKREAETRNCVDSFTPLKYNKQPLLPKEFVHLKIASLIERGDYEGQEKTWEREAEKEENRDLLADKADRLDAAVRKAERPSWWSEKKSLSQDEIAKIRFEEYKGFYK